MSPGAALRHGDFWRLWLTFAICGATTNGLIGTHLIPNAMTGAVGGGCSHDLAMMGLLDIVGTLGSGWLSDRYDKRVLLAGYYGVRGLSLLFLPYADNLTKLALFGILYGLDWIATVPPTVGLASDIFGSAPARSSWAGSSLAIRWAAFAAYGGGLLRVWFGNLPGRLPPPGSWPSARRSSSSRSVRVASQCPRSLHTRRLQPTHGGGERSVEIFSRQPGWCQASHERTACYEPSDCCRLWQPHGCPYPQSPRSSDRANVATSGGTKRRGYGRSGDRQYVRSVLQDG